MNSTLDPETVKAVGVVSGRLGGVLAGRLGGVAGWEAVRVQITGQAPQQLARRGEGVSRASGSVRTALQLRVCLPACVCLTYAAAAAAPPLLLQGYGVDVLDRDESQVSDGARKSSELLALLPATACACQSLRATHCKQPGSPSALSAAAAAPPFFTPLMMTITTTISVSTPKLHLLPTSYCYIPPIHPTHPSFLSLICSSWHPNTHTFTYIHSPTVIAPHLTCQQL
jgi:hypothetical protein